MNPRKDLLNISSLTDEEIHTLLDSAGPMKELFTKSVKKVPALKGKSVLTLFYEPSTRTRSSFEVAAERLSADVTNFTVSTSSVVKGESVQDTIATLQAMKVDYVIVRHYNSGLPNVIARHTCASVINAGDGGHLSRWRRGSLFPHIFQAIGHEKRTVREGRPWHIRYRAALTGWRLPCAAGA